jgi:hypothetical protein
MTTESTLEWQEPPAPTGRAGDRKAGGFTADGVTNTKLGDAAEKTLQRYLGFLNAHPGRRQGPFDLRLGRNAYEVKTVSVSSTEYKAKPKASEMVGKREYARQNGLVAHTMIAVFDPVAGRVYAYAKEGIGAYRLTGPQNGWSYLGSCPMTV